MVNLIIETFCKERGIIPSDLDNPKRKSKVWITRYMIWHYMHYNLSMSAGKLSRLFKRNIPSIFRGIRIIKHQFKYHEELRAEYYGIVSKLEGMTNATPSEDMK